MPLQTNIPRAYNTLHSRPGSVSNTAPCDASAEYSTDYREAVRPCWQCASYGRWLRTRQWHVRDSHTRASCVTSWHFKHNIMEYFCATRIIHWRNKTCSKANQATKCQRQAHELTTAWCVFPFEHFWLSFIVFNNRYDAFYIFINNVFHCSG